MLPEKTCPHCGETFTPETISTKYCPTCAPIVAYRKTQERKRRLYVQKKKEREEARRQRRIDHGME